MKDHPIWSDCKRCNRLRDCSDPFPFSGKCSNVDDHLCIGVSHLINSPAFSHEYSSLLNDDTSAASIFMRWRCGIVPTNEDFLYLREKSISFEGSCDSSDDKNEYFILLREFMCEALLCVAESFFTYYELGQAPSAPNSNGISATEILMGLLVNAILMGQPNHLKEYAKIGGEWTRWVLEIIKVYLWHVYQSKHLDLDNVNNDGFRHKFEEEWNILLEYQDIFYGFRVIPKLSPEHFVRYMKLPHGDERIRVAVSNYITHQATEYPHILTVFSSKFTEVAFEKRLRQMYIPLIECLTEDILKNMGIKGKDRDKTRSDIQSKVWQQYEQFRKDFKFYFKSKGKKALLGKLGMVDFSGNNELRQNFDQRMKSLDLSFTSDELAEVGFPYYLRQRFTNWVTNTYPPDKIIAPQQSLDSKYDADDGASLVDRITDDTNANIDRNIPVPQEPAVIGKEGTQSAGIAFLTIRQAANYYGISVDQLRRLDRMEYYPVSRVQDIFDEPFPLKPQMRLYPLTEEAQQKMRLAIIRLKKNSSNLEEGEFDRKTAAHLLGISESSLRRLEKKENIHPPRKGRIAVYDEELLNKFKHVIEKNSSSLQKTHERSMAI